MEFTNFALTLYTKKPYLSNILLITFIDNLAKIWYYIGINNHLMEDTKQHKDLKPYLGRVINGDCLEVLKLLPSDSVDTLITDPP